MTWGGVRVLGETEGLLKDKEGAATLHRALISAHTLV